MKKISLIAILIVALLVVFAGCGQSTPAKETSSEAPTSQEPAEAPESQEPTPEEPSDEAGLSGSISISGSTSVFPAMEEITKMFNAVNSDVEIDLQAGGSSVGVKQAGSKEVDLGMASRDLKDKEIEGYEGIQATVLCLDGVAIVVNAENGVADLTKDQVKAMYTGEITNWKEVGGADMPVNLVTRDASSGTREAFEGLFLGKDDAGEKIHIDESICSAVVNSNGAVATTVEGDAGAIGYMSLGIVSSYEAISSVKIDGVEATTDNMKSGDYTYYRNFNLITVGAPEGLVAELIRFCKTDEAVAYLEGKGYVMPK